MVTLNCRFEIQLIINSCAKSFIPLLTTFLPLKMIFINQFLMGGSVTEWLEL